ncbi:LysE family translocator [Desulfobacterales bacterium HSG17]|nr:LysE family translocator [Desulfobacterales bacterium HSG17]
MPGTEFFITSLLVVLVPGTGVIYTVSTGLFLGWRAAIAAAFGCTAGIIPHLLASVLGLSMLIHTSAVAFQILKYAGAAYLLFIAWSMWRETGVLKFDSSHKKTGLWKTALRGFLINILNPKLSIFFLAFLPLFVPADSVNPTLQMSFLSSFFMGLTLVIFILYGIFAHNVSAYLVNSPKAVVRSQRTFAVIFALLGAKLAVAEQ